MNDAHCGEDAKTIDALREENARLREAVQQLLPMVEEMLPKHGPCGWGTLAIEEARAALEEVKR